MKIWRFLILLSLALHPFSLPGTPQDGKANQVSHSPVVPAATGDSLVSFLSDSQSPIFIEELRLSSNNNDSAREMIYSRLIADRPNGIFHLGDMIAIGFYPETWRSTDGFLTRASAAHIPVFPTLGNHELMIFPSYGIEQFYDRFPWYRKTGYAVHVAKLAVVLLNSNFGQLTDDEKMVQLVWLDSTLVEF